MHISKILTYLLVSSFVSTLSSQGFGQSNEAPTVWEESNHTYRVRFTNPKCRTYYYKKKPLSISGEIIKHKPKNTYCTPSDAKASGAQKNSPPI